PHQRLRIRNLQELLPRGLPINRWRPSHLPRELPGRGGFACPGRALAGTAWAAAPSGVRWGWASAERAGAFSPPAPTGTRFRISWIPTANASKKECCNDETAPQKSACETRRGNARKVHGAGSRCATSNCLQENRALHPRQEAALLSHPAR